MTTKNVKHILGDSKEVSFVRITADPGKALTNDNGETVWNCIDVESIDGWDEIAAPSIDEDITDEEAFSIIFGGGNV